MNNEIIFNEQAKYFNEIREYQNLASRPSYIHTYICVSAFFVSVNHTAQRAKEMVDTHLDHPFSYFGRVSAVSLYISGVCILC